MLEKLSEIDQRFEKLTELLIQPETVADQQQFRTLSREHSELQEIVTAYRQYQKISQSLEENQLIADDASEDTELRDLAREEIQELEVQSKDLTQQLELLLLPKDPDDTRNTILEIRAGTGGDDGYSSRMPVARHLMQPTRTSLAGSPVLNKQLCPYMVLLRMGFTMPGLSPDPRCALTAPFHPYQTVCLAVCFLWHFP